MTAEPTSPPPPTGMDWPAREMLGTTGAVLVRPRMGDAAATVAMQADPRLWVGVPESFRTMSTVQQADDFRHFLAHWRAHGFGYWLVWEAGTGPDGGRPAGAVAEDGADPLGLGGLRWLWWDDRWVLNVYVRLAVVGQGRGLASALLRRAIDRLGPHLDQPTTVVVRTRPANHAMTRLAHRLGFVDAGTEQRTAGTYRVLSRRIGGNSAADGPDRAAAAVGAQRPHRGPPRAARPSVRLRPGGPMVVAGTVAVRCGRGPGDPDLEAVSDPDGRPDQALCRCGRSGTQPHCDRSHRTAPGDVDLDRSHAPLDPTPAGLVVPPALPRGPGVVVVDDGPLVVHGATLDLADGTRVAGPVSVCRCGRSRSQPWCDGAGCGLDTR